LIAAIPARGSWSRPSALALLIAAGLLAPTGLYGGQVGDAGRQFWRDLSGLATPPSLVALAGGGCLAWAAHPWDRESRGWRAGHPALRALFWVDNQWAASSVLLPAAAGSWAAVRLAGHPGAASLSAEVLRAVLVGSAVVAPTKRLVGRERPDRSDRRSFPSGHSANAFAAATVLASRRGPVGQTLWYLLAATVPAARIHAGRHYLSDGIAGAAMGLAAGWAVTRPARPTTRLTWMATPLPGGCLVQVSAAAPRQAPQHSGRR
jgi:membrane-associated phospholipid phosphatase